MKKRYTFTAFFLLMVTDLNYLQKMTDNDSRMIRATIELFLRQLAEMRSDFELLLANKNWLELSRLAHKIKSSALVMGIEQMIDEMKELELLAKEGKNVEKYPEYFARFNEMADIVEAEMLMFLDTDD